MKNNFLYIFYLLSAACVASAQAAQTVGDAAFFRSLLNIHAPAASPRPPGAQVNPKKISAPISSREAIASQLDEWLGIFQQLELQPAMDLAAMSREVVQELTNGAYNGLILGESHGTQPEINAGIRIVKDVLAGPGIGALSRESNTFQDADFLAAQGIPVLTFKNQFDPEPDVQAGFKAAGRKLLVTYTGHVHTSVQLKNYFVFTLQEGKPFGYFPGGKDMVTVEDSFLKERKQPLIVTMATEARVLRRIEQLFLKKFIGKDGVSGQQYLENLTALRNLWADKLLQYPAHVEDIYFVRSPTQANLFVGITPGDRRPVAIDAAHQVLSLPEFSAWLAADRLKTVESLWGSDESGVTYTVVAHKFNGDKFERSVRP